MQVFIEVPSLRTGDWIKLESDEDALRDAIQAVLVSAVEETGADSDPSALEWHTDGFRGVPDLGEICDIEALAALAEAVDTFGREVVAAYVDIHGTHYWTSDSLSHIEESYEGRYEDPSEYARDRCESLGDVPQWVADYVDYARMAEGWRDNREVFYVEYERYVHVFRNC